jgi:capsule polysaccharide export protein KpsC/LpsZ
MDNSARLQLQQMIKANNVTDQTSLIRELRHSDTLKENIQTLILLKNKYSNDPEKLHLEGMTECSFLFMHYTDIYNKIRKDEIDLQILFQFLEVLRKIENQELDQHEGSFEVGTLLKKIYIDSALKKADKINNMNSSSGRNSTHTEEKSTITWKQYKQCSR